ncbi:undecaprenyl-diphosphate phosphatase [Algoriphagus sp.]|jgi:undecaprenyl-diphosphatase|uniref:undecaprenyl-diphosphate phosphatase n=1 Tax=Algoriphagus sp. TaxID=1872435 RepID=UPI00271CE6FD|nr:undecaprenyl-diphosphate phosphatase [Algoriphagus sp.]MDO8967726.1 undecaprenyl-diphosphate phosphatase [Algoriphagus sp.]MDP3200010.1 undecaprenyl-diphosphate phosphatase [Algoriphagus sp.]
MTLFQSIIIAIVEGLTEFLPISSTGHMILVSAAMGIHEDEFVKTFEVFIQLGAILAIALMYIKRFFKSIDIYLKLFAAFLPTAIVGLVAYPYIKAYLFNPIVVSVSLILGGVFLILIDKKVIAQKSDLAEVEDMSYKNAFFIGLCQCLSMVPGTSRAAATIIGGVFNGLDKKQATEFSFLLAVPTMMAAGGYDLLKSELTFTEGQLLMLGVGFVVAFIAAWIAVKLFLKYVSNHGFTAFGWYRIALGILFLIFMWGTDLG